MRRLAVLWVVTACRTSPPVGAPVVANAVAAPGPVGDDADALVRWRALHLTGASYQAALADVDDAPAMARALLRAGDFACTDVDVQDECGVETATYAPLDPAAGFDDPCLRRALALWSLEQLDDARGVEDALAGLVAMREPETELQPAAFDLVKDDDALRLRLIAAADPVLAEQQAGLLTSTPALVEAAHRHLASAVNELAQDPKANHAVLLEAAADDDLDEAARLALINETLTHDRADDTTRALHALTQDDDCAIAEAAAEALADRGDPSALPSRPASEDASAHMRALCMLAAATLDDVAARLAAWVDPRGLSTTDDVDDDFAAPHERTTTDHVAAADVDVAAVIESVTSWSCSGLTCELGDEDHTVTFRPRRGSLVISEVYTHRFEGCGC